MQKPDTIRYREFVAHLQTVINDSQLPAFVMIPVVREALQQLAQQDENQYRKDMESMSGEEDSADGRQKNK